MENITGFIVDVKPINGEIAEYNYDGKKIFLLETDIFIGYFYQMTDCRENEICKNAHIIKIKLIDKQKLLFQYEREAIFDISKVIIKIRAKRGPESNNKYLPKEYDKYETWNSIGYDFWSATKNKFSPPIGRSDCGYIFNFSLFQVTLISNRIR